MSTLLIDGDVLAYRSAFSCEGQREVHVETKIADLIDNICWVCTLDPLWGDNAFVYLTGSGNFRKDIDPEYKANRSSSNRPEHLDYARYFLECAYSAEVVNGKEADDAIATHAYQVNYECTIASVDKDFLQIPCTFYNIQKDALVKVSQEDADNFFYRQCLEGDRVDNVKGVPGIGPKKADKILKDYKEPKDMWDQVVKTFGDPEEALKTARLLWLQREEEELWEPPK